MTADPTIDGVLLTELPDKSCRPGAEYAHVRSDVDHRVASAEQLRQSSLRISLS